MNSPSTFLLTGNKNINLKKKTFISEIGILENIAVIKMKE